MQQQRWQRIDEIFQLALQLDENQLAAFLDETCSGDADLRSQISRLLAHYNQAGTFLEEPAIEMAVGEIVSRQSHLLVEQGEMILHYRVGARIGSGGMGVVYKGEDLKLERSVALKFLHNDLRPETQAAGELQAEARAASSLNHPNICTIYAIEEHQGQPVLVMELLEGENLHQRLETGAVSLEELIRWARQICDALAAAHAKGIVHRDIKPANIFLAADGRLKLLDFGIATWMRAADPAASCAKVAGTMLYMSPEQLRGLDLDGRSDLFSLGVVLYELATGLRPFERSHASLTMNALLEEPAAPPSTQNPKLPADFDRLIARLLEKDVGRRYGSASEVLRDLQKIEERLLRRQQRWKIAGTAASLSLAFGLAAIVLQKQPPPPVLTNKDTLVLGDFPNRTGDRIFNNTLRQGLAVQLQQSPFLSLISEERMQHTLQLMAKPSDTPLTAQIAQEICVRTGSAAVLDGSIETLGKQYVVKLTAKNCQTGELVYTGQADTTRPAILRTITQMASTFRERAGESLNTIAQHSTPLSEATTPSLEAWKSFSEGMHLALIQGHAVAIPFLKRAIEIDPHFATAMVFLGRDYSAIGEMDLASHWTSRAFQERNRANDQERFMIDFSYDRLVTGNLEKALATCDLWTRTFPRSAVASGLSSGTARTLGRYDKMRQESLRAIEVDADQPYPYAHLAMTSVYQNNFSEAQRWLRRASDRKLMLPDFLMVRHRIAFLRGDQAEMERTGIAAEGMSEIQDWIWGERAAVLAFSGRLQEARAMSRRAIAVALAAERRESAAQHEAASSVREAFFGNYTEARARAAASQSLSNNKDAAYGAAFTYALIGDFARAQNLEKDLERRYPDDTVVRFSFLPTLRAVAATKRGEANKALENLRAASRYELGFLGCCSVGFVGSLYPIYARGEAYLAAQRSAQAAEEFQKIIRYRGLAGPDPIAVLAHWRRGKALMMEGKDRDAAAEYRQFLLYWQKADAGIPILTVVKREYASLLAHRTAE